MSPAVVAIYFIGYCGGIIVGLCVADDKPVWRNITALVTATAAITVAHFGGVFQ